MAQVTRNPDDTFLVTLTTREQKTLQRWSNDPGTGPPIAPRSKAAQLEAVITAALQDKAISYRALDGPTMRDQYDALAPTKQAQVDAILSGG